MNVKFYNLPAYPAKLEEFLPLALLKVVLAAILFLLVAVVFCYADDGAVVPSTEASIVSSILSTTMPIIILLISTLGPVAGAYIVKQIISFLGVTNQTKKIEVEAKLRDVLHFCAANALKYAFTKAGLPLDSALSPSVISDALFYINNKNPDTVATLGLTDDDLTHILLTKAAEVAASVPLAYAIGTTETVATPVAAAAPAAP